MLTATLILKVRQGVLVKHEEHHDNDVEGYTGEHLIRGEEGFTFVVDHFYQHGVEAKLELSDPIDDEGLHRDPMRALPGHGWSHHLVWPPR